jgi:hypothetical protein
MKNIFLLLIILLLINSCGEPSISNDLDIQNNSSILISGINSFDCIMCFGNINQKYKSIINEFQIPKTNRFVFVKNTRKVAGPNFLKNYVQLDSTFNTQLIQDESLIKKIEVLLYKKQQDPSYYAIISSSNKVIFIKDYKP